jgi:hypothetical protein
MSRTSLGDSFARVFDARNILVFLVSSLALGIVSNSLYDFLVSQVGNTSLDFVRIGLSAALILVFTVIVLYGWLRAFAMRKGDIGTIVPREQIANAHAGLILAVGLTEPGPEKGIIAHHAKNGVLRHCWLLVTPEVEQNAKWGDLRQYLIEQNAEVHRVPIDNGHQADLGYQATLQAIREAQTVIGASPWIVDITSGLRATTVGMVLACRDTNTPIEYYANPRSATGEPIPHLKAVPVLLQAGPALLLE